MRYYAKNYPHLDLKETSVRRFMNHYQTQLKTSTKEIPGSSIAQDLVSKKQGHPIMVDEEFDEQVREYIRELRKLGVINAHVVIAVGMRLVLNKDANLLEENGGHICLTKNWARYLLSRMGFVKRRANSKSKVSVEQFDELKELFLLDFNNVIEMDDVPGELVINWD